MKRADQIVVALRENPKLTMTEIVNYTGMPHSTAWSVIRQLEDQGVVLRSVEEDGWASVWELTE